MFETLRICSSHEWAADVVAVRTVDECMQKVQELAPTAKYFFMRETANFHCSPCDPSFTGLYEDTFKGNKAVKLYEIVSGHAEQSSISSLPYKVNWVTPEN